MIVEIERPYEGAGEDEESKGNADFFPNVDRHSFVPFEVDQVMDSKWEKIRSAPSIFALITPMRKSSRSLGQHDVTHGILDAGRLMGDLQDPR